ncbi:hypothetical protein ACFWXO_13800 [Kitasatospora sp. NPDC059088]|uniref:hypothetical protein n=1 Tax=Kitasatospora sp. NPDC059088 TaxID=3346722 RepID=UPI0036C62B38
MTRKTLNTRLNTAAMTAYALVGLGAGIVTELLDALWLRRLGDITDRLHAWSLRRAERHRLINDYAHGVLVVPGPDGVYLPHGNTCDVLPWTPLDQARTGHLAGICCPADTPLEACPAVQEAAIADDPKVLEAIEADLLSRFKDLDAQLGGPVVRPGDAGGPSTG